MKTLLEDLRDLGRVVEHAILLEESNQNVSQRFENSLEDIQKHGLRDGDIHLGNWIVRKITP